MPRGDTREELLDAAQALIQRVGANAMSYQDLSEAVGIRKASIHHHFPTKADLLDALIDRYSDGFLGLLDRIGSSRMDGAGKLRRLVDLFEGTLREDACEKACPCGMLGAEIGTLAPEAARRLRGFYRAVVQRIADYLRQGAADGSLKVSGDATILAWMLFSLLEGGMLVARVEGGHERFRAMVRQFMKLAGA